MTQSDSIYTVNEILDTFRSGQWEATCRLCEALFERGGQRPDVLTIYGDALRQLGRIERAKSAYMTAIVQDDSYADAYRHMGDLLLQQKQHPEAIHYYRLALGKRPGDMGIWIALSNALVEAGELSQAIQLCQLAIDTHGGHHCIYTNMGNAFNALGNKERALECYAKALEQTPNFTIAAYNQAITLEKLGRINEAIERLRSLTKQEQNHLNAHIKLGDLLKKSGRSLEAVSEYVKSIELAPNMAELHNNLGVAYAQLSKWNDALNAYVKARDLGCNSPVIYKNIGDTYQALRLIEPALDAYRHGLNVAPGDLLLFAQLIHAQQKLCDWSDLNHLRERLLLPTINRTNDDAPPPFIFLGLPIEISPSEHLAVAKRYANSLKSGISLCFEHNRVSSASEERKIKIGYLSADFHNHATAHLMLGLFRRHDRQQFEIIAYSMGYDDGSFYRKRIREDCDKFVDISALSELEAARKINADGIDILVDLKGYTGDAKPIILAYRPAPIQVAYLGYPGTMGADFIDYVIADKTVLPLEQAQYYAEKPAYLPYCYQVNDIEQPIATEAPSREDCGLPQDGFVFCCFNAAFKIEPQVFELWMRILQRVPNSVLWLQGDRPSMVHNLKKEAAKYAIEASRLVFAGFQPKDRHLARLKHADLFLDTYFYNAHTTASDALWAGVPVITRVGTYFPSRVAASLLNAIGLSELVVNDTESYVDLAVQLALSPEALRNIRIKLQENRTTWPLFDTDRFTRSLEKLYGAMWKRWSAGLAPLAMEVTDGPTANAAIDQQMQTAIDLYHKGDYQSSLTLCQSILNNAANRVDAWTLYGMLCRRNKNTQQAIAAYQRATQIDPTYVDAYNNLANLYREEGNCEASIANYLKALQLKPEWAEAHNSLAATYQAAGNLEEAFRHFSIALQLDPENPDFHWDHSLCLLLAGRYSDGWKEYEWRWRRGIPAPRGFSQPFWEGEDLSGKTILVYDEQGYGDGLQFIRFLPLLKRYGGRIILEVLQPLHSLISTSMHVDEIIARGDALPAFDCHIPLLSLPRVLNITLETLPDSVPYLRAPEERMAYWKQHLSQGNGLRVAVTWAGNPNVKSDHWRSPRLPVFMPFIDGIKNITFYSIQMGDGRRDLSQYDKMPPNFIDLGESIRDFADTAAILSQIDLLITSDTSAAHLAGAVGCKTWVMLHTAPDWRWLLKRNDSPWYPTLKLYRQTMLGDWADVSRAIKQDLEILNTTLV